MQSMNGSGAGGKACRALLKAEGSRTVPSTMCGARRSAAMEHAMTLTAAVALAAAHQTGAVLLFTVALWTTHELR